ncbi:MAG: flippase-like domain-containing protein [Bacteroidales bacterium]|nr:flippase-like domain-containing protein [Bacteroidales bacterium]
MKKRIVDTLKIVFFLSLGAFFIWLFMHNLTPEEKKEIYNSLISANYWWLALSIMLGLTSHLSRAARWNILIEPMGYKPRLRTTFFAVMIGYLANLALPRLGEVSRCGVLARYEKIPLQKGFGTVITERTIDLISLGLAFLINFIIHIDKFKLFQETRVIQNIIGKYQQLENPGIIYWIFFGIIALLIFIFYRARHKIEHTKFYQKIKEIILGFLEGIKSLTKIKKPFWFIFHSIFIWILYLMMSWVVFNSIDETRGLSLGIGLAVLVFGSIGIVVVQGGIGIYPWIVAEILALYHVPEVKGYALGWLLWIGQTLTIVIVGILSLTLLPVLNRNKNEFSQPDPE